MDVLKPLTVPVNRFAWVDYLKVFGTLCVLLGHCNLQGEAITQWIFSFHMPLFFLISGFLYKPTGLKLCFVKSLKTLLLPYVLLNAICFAYFSYFALRDGYFNVSFIESRLGAIALGLGYSTGNLIPVCGPLWFLIALFVAKLLLSVCRLTVSQVFVSVLAIFVCAVLRFKHVDLLFPLDSVLLAFPFLVIGHHIKEVFSSVITKPIWQKLSSAVILFLIAGVIDRINGRVDINHTTWGNDMLLFYICGVVFFLASFLVLSNLRPYKGLSLISSCTMIVMGVGHILTPIVANLYRGVFNIGTTTGVHGLLIALIVMGVCVGLTFFAKKWCPAILGYR